jgi:hypothetical protein
LRTVLSVDLSGVDPDTKAQKTNLRIVRTPFDVKNVPEALQSLPFNLCPDDLPDWTSRNGVFERGRILRDSISLHPGVKAVLNLLGATRSGESSPLYVILSASDAELLCWETLCDSQDRFIALDRRWPIGRITNPIDAKPREPAEWRLPVRMMAVISAFAIHGQTKEWDQLRAALTAARSKGLPVKLKVLAGHPALRAEIDKAIAEGLADVEVSHVEASPSRLGRDITDWEPNILHFFCHGSSDSGGQYLELATGGDYNDIAARSGSVRIGVRQLNDMGIAMANPWLLTLNCCSGGQPSSNLHSIAHQVVSEGFPVAVAMAEPVDAGDAYEFSGAFYRSLFLRVQAAAAKAGSARRFTFEWIDAMYDARQAIVDRHAEGAQASPQWTRPILYIRGVEPFQFDLPHSVPPDESSLVTRVRSAIGMPAEPKPVTEQEAAVHRLKARTIAEWLRTSGRQMSEADRVQVMKTVLTDVPESYWPSAEGSFSEASDGR